MKMKRFFGPDMRSVIQQVRDSQGPDAVILSNRRVEGGIEVVAAIDYDEDAFAQVAQHDASRASQPAPPQEPPSADRRGDRQPTLASLLRKPFADRAASLAAALKMQSASDAGEPAAPITETVGIAPPTRLEPLAPIDRPEPTSPIAPSAARLESIASAQAAAAFVGTAHAQAEQIPVSEPPKSGGLEDRGLAAMRRELQAMRDMLEQQLTQLAWQDTVRRHPLHASALHELMTLGMAPDLARDLVQRLPAQMLDAEDARVRILSLLAQSLPPALTDPLAQGGVVALLGTTGVGKTTTLAKLAARFALSHGTAAVALVSTDGYRIGAHEQLRMFGRLLGVTVHIVTEPAELGATLSALADVPLVLIDSAGMGPRDGRMADQYALFTQIRQSVASYLVLSASSQPDTLDETVRRFARLKPAGAVITKVDEASNLGGVLSVTLRHRLPVAYLSDGQRVPEDLHRAAIPELLARAVELGRQRREEQAKHVNQAVFAQP